MKAIIYYSYTGNTKKIAEKIKDTLNIDIEEIKPTVPYTKDYNELVEQAKSYVKENEMPEINKISLDLNKYDEIILLTPVWWYTYASPINTFLNTYDLKNKIIYPIATNAGWLGHTIEDIGNKVAVKNPLSLVFDGNNLKNEDDLKNWLKEIK